LTHERAEVEKEVTMSRRGSPYVLLFALLAICCTGAVAQEETPADTGADGRWRAELSTAFGFDSGKNDRGGDVVVNGSIEYEWSVFARGTLGLRAYPLFMYAQNDPDETIAGVGFGVTGRVYQRAGERTGFFVEGGAGALVHSNQIEGNGSNINFLLEAGVGYQFRNDWHVTLQVQHISNSSLDEDNAGANSVGVGVGFRF
jgi:hypothetical protein